MCLFSTSNPRRHRKLSSRQLPTSPTGYVQCGAVGKIHFEQMRCSYHGKFDQVPDLKIQAFVRAADHGAPSTV